MAVGVHDRRVGKYCSHRLSGKPGRGTREAIPQAKGGRVMVEGVAEVEVVAVEAAAVAAVVTPGRMALQNVTRVMSNALSVMTMGTMQIGVQGRRRRRKHIW